MPLALLALALSASAAPPEVSSEDDGTVVGHVVIDAPADAVRAVLGDPVRTGDLSPDVLSVENVGGEGDCHDLKTETRGLWRSLTYRSRRCPTAEGWHETLLEPGDFSELASTWRVETHEGGTEVTLRVQTDVNLPVPQGVLRRHERRNVLEILGNLTRAVLPERGR